MTRNSITDVPGLRVGHAEDRRIASGVTAVLFDQPCIASCAIGGGAPGERDTALLQPGRTVERVDALVLSGGSAFGLDAMGGVQALLRGQGRGHQVGQPGNGVRVPIVPGAILFDLLNGGDKAWGQSPVYWHLGHRAAWLAGLDVAQGSVGAGLGATTANLKGGIGTASARSSAGFTIGALAAVNALGRATIGDGPHFWAAPLRARRRVRRPRLAGRVAVGCFGVRGQARRPAGDDARHSRDRRRADQIADESPRHHGAGRARPRGAPEPRRNGRGYRLRRGHGAGGGLERPRRGRARHARRRLPRPRYCARDL